MRFCRIPKAFQCPWSAVRYVEFVPWLTSSLLVGLYYWTLVVVQFDDSIPSHCDCHHASFQSSRLSSFHLMTLSFPPKGEIFLFPLSSETRSASLQHYFP